tara:strand:+ start:21063 stop:21578 length:516 start_codon:yes stop_codon:yes gene_type:complete
MKDTTKKLIIYAAELFETKTIPANQIYDLLLNSVTRKKEVTKTRQLVCYFLYNHYEMTLIDICKEFRFANHTSVLYAVNEIHFSLRTDKRMRYRHDYMLDKINGLECSIIRHIPVLKTELSDVDKLFIQDNFFKGYSISYYSDILIKHKQTIKAFLKFLKEDSKKSNTLQS